MFQTDLGWQFRCSQGAGLLVLGIVSIFHLVNLNGVERSIWWVLWCVEILMRSLRWWFHLVQRNLLLVLRKHAFLLGLKSNWVLSIHFFKSRLYLIRIQSHHVWPVLLYLRYLFSNIHGGLQFFFWNRCKILVVFHSVLESYIEAIIRRKWSGVVHITQQERWMCALFYLLCIL